MKLQKLTIHNIASIEDATIDFANGPLANESIFLICGETGSGKSTILDAICLALYKDTPRMKRTTRESYQDQAITSLDHVQTNDCRQLVRRNAREAFVELDFDDNDEVTYTARWSVDRARTGNLKKAEWQLYNHATDETIHKEAEIATEIHRIIGLDFEQFCRTTLLAQGEFTRFLQSNPHEKADILERLTNTDIYSQIGTRIFECWKEYKTAYEMQRTKSEQIRLLSEEERAGQATAITQKETEIQALRLQIETLQVQIQWLSYEQQLSQKIAEAQQAYQTTQKALQSEGFQEAEKLLHDWDLSAEARTHYREEQRLQKQLKAEKDEADTIIGKLLKLHPNAPADTHQLLPLLQQEEETFSLHCRSIQQSITRIQTAIAQQEAHLKSCKLEEKETRKEQLLQQQEQLQGILNRFSLLDEKQKLLQASQTDIHSHQQQLQALKEQSVSLQQQLSAASQARQLQECLVSKLKEATENWAKEARRKLKEGDSCPVCGHLIDHVLSDESFQSQLEEPESELNNLRQQEELVRSHHNQVAAEEKQQLRAFESACLKQKEAQEAYNELQQSIVNACRQLHLDQFDADNIRQQIESRRKEIDHINQALKAGKEIASDIATRQKQIQELQQAWAQENEKRHSWHHQIELYHSLNEQRMQSQSRQESSSAEINRLQQQLQAFVAALPAITFERLGKLASYPEDKVQDMRARMQQTREESIKKETSWKDLEKEHQAWMAKKPSLQAEETLPSLTRQKAEKESLLNLLHQSIGQIRQTLLQDEKARVQQEKERKQAEEAYHTYLKWNRLKELFGSADGKTFRAIAQSFILKELLQNANYYLRHFTDRYHLEGQGITLTILLRDFYEGGVTRPVSTLSGGESFLISLALALGLSSLNRNHLSMDTLFIDEGFGTLSGDYLQTVMDTLEKLHQLGGKRVGIISHVEGLRERIRTQIQVKRIDNSRSIISCESF